MEMYAKAHMFHNKNENGIQAEVLLSWSIYIYSL